MKKTVKIDSYLPYFSGSPFLTDDIITWFRNNVGPETGRSAHGIVGHGWKLYRERHDHKKLEEFTLNKDISWFLEVEDERNITLWGLQHTTYVES